MKENSDPLAATANFHSFKPTATTGKSGQSHSRGQPRRLVGIKNIGNTCYMASVLQALFALQQIRAYFLNGTYDQDREVIGGRLQSSKSTSLSNSFHQLLKKTKRLAMKDEGLGATTT